MAGRPTSCTPDVIAKAEEYISTDKEVNYESHDHVVPSIVGLCIVINVSRTTLYEWSEKDDNPFPYIFKQIMDTQQFALTNKGLKGDTNSVITKLMLTKHGYSDRQDTKHDVAEGVVFNMSFGNSKQD